MRVFMRTVLISTTVFLAIASGGQAQEGNAAAGEKLFKKCLICHTESADESRRGPSLAGVFGRTAGTAEGYPYSDAMRAAGEAGLVWQEEELAAFIKSPQAKVKGSWMAFPACHGQRTSAMLSLI
jgi:cytochrome c